MTWKEMKDFCLTLNEDQLEKTVVIWREQESIYDMWAFCLEEDHYIDPEDYENGCFSESDAKSMLYNYPNGMDDLKKVYDKGCPLLGENF